MLIKKRRMQNGIQNYFCPPCVISSVCAVEMAARYDEDLYKNPYFSRILSKHQNYLAQAVACKGTLCVPKYSIACSWSPTLTDIEDHILLPAKDVVNDDDDFVTVSNKMVHAANGGLVTNLGFDTVRQVRVLFAETFHIDNGDSYRVFCIDGLLNASVDLADSGSTEDLPPLSYKQCLELLWSHPGGHKARDTLDNILNTFAATYQRLEGETLRSIVDAANTHFTKSMQLLLKNSVMRRNAQQNPVFMDNLKLAVETYMMTSVHKLLFPVITATVAGQDAEINKINRNLVDLQPAELGIRKIFSQNITPARKELNSLNAYSTPMEKLLCLKHVTFILTKPPKSTRESTTKVSDSVTSMSTDDLLPILIFLIVKSEIPNWTANLVYMQHFHFSKSSDDDEFGFYLASVEAALEHIKSGNIKNEIKPLKRERWNSMFVADLADSPVCPTPRMYSRQVSHSVLDEFFKLVQEGDVIKVQEMLQQPYRRSEDVHQKLCHPLCSCDECDKLLSHLRGDSNLVTVYSRDSHGYTALHIAAYYGQDMVIDFLIQNNAIVDTTDYLGLTPLHLACQRGLENVILRLLHFGADVTVTDSEGNSALHLCCANGHEDCVKTLLTHDSSRGQLEVNSANEFGDTALHFAAKWGYESIVKILLENGANPKFCNKRKQTPVSLAQNVIVQRWLQSATEDSDFQKSNLLQSAAMTSDSDISSSTEKLTTSHHEKEINFYEPEPSGRVQTASLETANENKKKCKEEKLFQAVIDGNKQQVEYCLGIKRDIVLGDDDDDDGDDDDDVPLLSPSVLSLDAMCHPLCQCARCLLIEKSGNRISVNSRTALGLCPIHLAILHNRREIVELLISCSADVNVQNHKSLTPLHLACCVRNLLIMDVLVKIGAKLNVRDANGNTPLLVAACNGFPLGVQLLLKMCESEEDKFSSMFLLMQISKAGANVNAINHKGNTALHEAVKRDDLNVSAMLLDAGADPRSKNKLGKLPMDETDDPAMQEKLKTAICRIEEAEINENNNTVFSNEDKEGSARQMTVKELFAAFEEKDLHRLQRLTSSIRSFDPTSRLRQTKTRDLSTSHLDMITHKHLIQTFDRGTLRKTNPVYKSDPLHLYALSKSCDLEEPHGFSACDDSKDNGSNMAGIAIGV